MAGAIAGAACAQPSGGPSPPAPQETARPAVIGPGLRHNIVSIEQVMREIHQLMLRGPFTPRQATEVSEMMIRLGAMMQEMSGPGGERLASQHERGLAEIRRQLERLKQQMQSQ